VAKTEEQIHWEKRKLNAAKKEKSESQKTRSGGQKRQVSTIEPSEPSRREKKDTPFERDAGERTWTGWKKSIGNKVNDRLVVGPWRGVSCKEEGSSEKLPPESGQKRARRKKS